jgi:hypothetical protein
VQTHSEQPPQFSELKPFAHNNSPLGSAAYVSSTNRPSLCQSYFYGQNSKMRYGYNREEIRVLNSAGEVVETISFADNGKKF